MRHVLLIAALCAATNAHAQSQPAPDLRGTNQSPVVVTILESPMSPEQAAQADSNRQEEVAAREAAVLANQVIAALTVGLLLVGAAQVYVSRKQAAIAEEQSGITREQSTIAREQASIAKRQNDIIESQTGHMMTGLELSRNAADISRDSLETSREIERAYISFAHSDVNIKRASTPGQFVSANAPPLSIRVKVHIRNDGRTPGDFIGGFLGWTVSDTPQLPDLSRSIGNMTPAFLLPDKDIWFDLKIEEAEETLRKIWRGETRIWLVGEADYIDRFGQPHTARYGRMFDPAQQSFVFTYETGPWNFDRRMHPDKVSHYAIRDGQAYSTREET